MITMARRRGFLALAAALAAGSAASAATLTLQQGVAGYGGCRDSFIGSGGYSDDANQNFGPSPELILNAERYSL